MMYSLGNCTVATPGTPINALAQAQAANRDSGEDADLPTGLAVRAYSITLQAWHANTGRIWVGTSADMDTMTGAFILGFLPLAGSSMTILIERGQVGGLGLLDLRNIWLDAAAATNGAVVSYLRVQ